jgi:hypothetical protein
MAKRPHESAPLLLTAEFGHELEAARSAWLHRRFIWYTFSVSVLSILALLIGILDALGGEGAPAPAPTSVLIAANLLTCVLYVAALVYARRHELSRDAVLRAASWLIVVGGVVHLLAGVVATQIDPQSIDHARLRNAGAVVGLNGLLSILLIHLFACLFLPLTPRESVRPMLPLLAINAAITVVFARSFSGPALVTVLLSPLVVGPGSLVCWWRQGRFSERFTMRAMRGRYLEMRRELTDARRIHESLFPRPQSAGAFRLDYAYEPMRHIGGDYLYARFPVLGEHAGMNLVMVDVTGHGIPAALTVNRLYGELERLYAEQPDIAPGQVVRALNRYVYLTLADHALYVSALCVRFHPDRQVLEFANAGHPPAFIRGVDGTIDDLPSTSFLLGAVRDIEFDDRTETRRFIPGDTLLAYTDGAIEARDASGRMLGTEGLRRVIASAGPVEVGQWPAAVLAAVDAFRFGPPADDTLIASVTRLLVAAPLSPRGIAQGPMTRAYAARGTSNN